MTFYHETWFIVVASIYSTYLLIITVYLNIKINQINKQYLLNYDSGVFERYKPFLSSRITICKRMEILGCAYILVWPRFIFMVIGLGLLCLGLRVVISDPSK